MIFSNDKGERRVKVVEDLTWSLIFMGKPKNMDELMHKAIVVKAVVVQHHLILAIFLTNR